MNFLIVIEKKKHINRPLTFKKKEKEKIISQKNYDSDAYCGVACLVVKNGINYIIHFKNFRKLTAESSLNC